MHHIFDNMINELKERLSEKRLEITVTEEARNFLIEKGWDSRFGARPLRRVIQKEVEDVLSTMIISGILDDNSHAVVDFKNDKINIHKE